MLAGQIVFNVNGGSGVAGGASGSTGMTTGTTGAMATGAMATGTTTTKTDCVSCQQVIKCLQVCNLFDEYVLCIDRGL